MEYPLISIIVPIYNVENYLNECIQSIIKQTYTNLEILLIDDGSPDDSPKICDLWATKDSRIKVIHKTNGGLSDARNCGIEASKGDYIYFLDSDDFIDKKTIYTLWDLLTSTDSDISCGGILKYENGNSTCVYNHIIKSDKVIFSGIDQLKNMLNAKTDCSAWNKLYKRSIIGDHRFIKGRYNEDVIFLFPLYIKCNKVAYTNVGLYYYRTTPGSITAKVSIKTMDYLRNAIEMKKIVEINKIPVKSDIKNYYCRTCLELGYSIQRDKMQQIFLNETKFVKKEISRLLLYMITNSFYNLKDMAHAIICLIKL